MPNPLDNINIFIVKRKGKEHTANIITTKYSESGLTVTAYQNYASKGCGFARGGGYDKTHTALAEAIENIYDVFNLKYHGSSGFEAVKFVALKHGVEVKTLSEVI